MDNEIRASKVLTYLSSNPKGSVEDELNGIYKTNDFGVFVDMMRSMVETYLLKGPCKQYTLQDFIFGYSDPSIQLIHEQLSIFEGKEVALSSYVNTVLTEMSPYSENQVQGIYTGSLNIQEISSVRFANDKNYANRLMDVHNGTDW